MPTKQFTELTERAFEQYGLVTTADEQLAGYAPGVLDTMARRGQIERVSHGLYRIPFIPGGELSAYMAATLWPRGVRGILTHQTALDLWEVCDINPGKIHIAVPKHHRTQRQIPKAYVLHHEHLHSDQVTLHEGIPIAKFDVTIRQCEEAHVGKDLLHQALENGRARGLLNNQRYTELRNELGFGVIGTETTV